jgi:hypothetical protein
LSSSSEDRQSNLVLHRPKERVEVADNLIVERSSNYHG